MTTNPAVGGTKSGDSTVAGRSDDGSERIGTDGERNATCTHSRAGAAGGSTAPGVNIPRVDAGSGERGIWLIVEAAGQFNQRELADEDRSRVAQPLNDGRILVELLIPERAGAPTRRGTNRRDQILDSVRDAMKRSAIASGAKFLQREVGFSKRSVAIDRDDRIQPATDRLQPLDEILHEINRCGFPSTEHIREFANWEERVLDSLHMFGPSCRDSISHAFPAAVDRTRGVQRREMGTILGSHTDPRYDISYLVYITHRKREERGLAAFPFSGRLRQDLYGECMAHVNVSRGKRDSRGRVDCLGE